MKEVISSYIGKNKLIAIFDDCEDPDDFYLGFILKVDEEFVLLNAVNKYGEIDGFRAICLQNIFSVEEYSLYSNKMVKLFEIKKQVRENINLSNKSVLFDIIEHAKLNSFLIKLNNDDGRIGYIKEYNDELLSMNLLNCYNDDLGMGYYTVNNINGVICGNKLLNDLQLLNKL